MTYSTALTLNRQRYARRGQNTTSFNGVREKQRLGPITSSVLLVIMACVLGMLYLTQVTHTNTLSYKIDGLQTAQENLKTEREELEVGAARLQAIETIKNSPAASGMVSVAPSGNIQN